MNDLPRRVTIYCDGGAEPNPGPGGYGVVLLYQSHRRELAGAFRRTTNNRMEILACIKGLLALKSPCIVKLYSDSKYVVEAMSKGWAAKWQTCNWKRTKEKPVQNADLWQTLLDLCTKHQVTFEWVKGHAGNPENERCDVLSMQFLQHQNHEIDHGYESVPPPAPRAATPRAQPAFLMRSRTKITVEGQPCRKCSTPVIKRIPNLAPKPGRGYFEYYLFCPSCKTTYMVENARRQPRRQDQ